MLYTARTWFLILPWHHDIFQKVHIFHDGHRLECCEPETAAREGRGGQEKTKGGHPEVVRDSLWTVIFSLTQYSYSTVILPPNNNPTLSFVQLTNTHTHIQPYNFRCGVAVELWRSSWCVVWSAVSLPKGRFESRPVTPGRSLRWATAMRRTLVHSQWEVTIPHIQYIYTPN